VTEEKKADYMLEIETIDADMKNSNLMKLGETYESVLKAGEFKVYRFMLDDMQTLTISQTNSIGKVGTILSFDEHGANAVLRIEST
jgi:hypothetical protein